MERKDHESTVLHPLARQPELLQSLGSWGAVSIVVGTIIGSGIFLVPKTMVSEVGSPSMVLLVFVVGGLLSLCGALTYAELGAAMPYAGGEYVYLREAYGPLPSFLYGWTQFWVIKSGRSPPWRRRSSIIWRTFGRRSKPPSWFFRCRGSARWRFPPGNCWPLP
jgi:hypothetical protein